MKDSHDLLDSKISELTNLANDKGITQEQILEEMNDKERAVIEKLGGLPIMRALMNLAGIPIGAENSTDRDEHEQ